MSNKSTSANTGTQNNSTRSVQDTDENDKNPATKLAASRSMLSEDTRNKLQNIVNQLEEKSTNSKFLKFVDGEEKVLLFDPNRVEHVVVKYPTKEGEEESKPTHRIKFFLKEAHGKDNGNSVITDEIDEIEWTTSETTGKEILRWVLKGFLLLDISRKGSGKFDTKYTVAPHL